MSAAVAAPAARVARVARLIDGQPDHALVAVGRVRDALNGVSPQ